MEDKNKEASNKVIRICTREPQVSQPAHATIYILVSKITFLNPMNLQT